jgi:AraC-like DNA-binding protein
VRVDSSTPAVTLRGCLDGMFPTLRAEAIRIISEAITRSANLAQAADVLGIEPRTLHRFRERHPEIDAQTTKPPPKRGRKGVD